MKTLKVTTHWTTEEADSIYQLLDAFQCALWESYGKDIEQLYRAHGAQQLEMNMEGESNTSPGDDNAF